MICPREIKDLVGCKIEKAGETENTEGNTEFSMILRREDGGYFNLTVTGEYNIIEGEQIDSFHNSIRKALPEKDRELWDKTLKDFNNQY